jgi:hypothetical protein
LKLKEADYAQDNQNSSDVVDRSSVGLAGFASLSRTDQGYCQSWGSQG